MTRFDLNILGCGSATPTHRHLPSCQVINVRDNLFMIDCGEAAQMSFRRCRLKMDRLSDIFISHLHGDHVFGLFGLLSTMALNGKTGVITIHTFAEGVKQIGGVLDFYCRERPFELRFNVISTQKEVIYEDNSITVTAFPMRHRVPTVGFRFDEKPKLRHINSRMTTAYEVPHYKMNGLREVEDFVTPDGKVIPNHILTTDADPCHSYAYCSDTTYCDKVVDAVEGVDWLYHEATYDNSLAPKAHARYHSTAGEAGQVAREAGAKHLIIGHYSKRYNDEDLLVREASEAFGKPALAATEGMVIDLNSD